MDRWLEAQVAEHPSAPLVRFDLRAECTATLDAELLRQAVVNLLDNALHAVCEARPDGSGRIRVCSSSDAETVIIAVSDNGAGFPEEARSRAFEPLFSTKSYGFGLGMSVVQRVVDVHQGNVELVTGEDEGTMVSLRLPREQGGV